MSAIFMTRAIVQAVCHVRRAVYWSENMDGCFITISKKGKGGP